MIVLDASACLELLLGTPTGNEVAKWIRPPEEDVHVPHLLDLEVTQALRRYVLNRSLAARRAELALQHLRQVDFERHRHDLLLPRIWALRENLTAYDAVYVALAEVLNATLLTTDRRMAAAPVKANIKLVH